MKKLAVRFFAVLAIAISTAVSTFGQNGFAYQAVIRDGDGKLVSNKQVEIKFTLLHDGNSYYAEKQSVKTNEYGNIQVTVGAGEKLDGDYAAVPWNTLDIKMSVAVDVNGTGEFLTIGEVPIQSSPYALYAQKAGGYSSAKSAVKGDEALFSVNDANGNPVFAVFNSGIVVYVDDTPDSNRGDKALRSGFVVKGRSATKDGDGTEYFAVTADGTHIYVDDPESSSGNKALRSGFVVKGRSATKEGEQTDYLAVGGDGTTVYVDDADNNQGDKALRSGFVVKGRSATKDGEQAEYFAANTNQTTVYVDDPDSYRDSADKALRSGFVVKGRSATKDDAEYLTVGTNGTQVFIDGADSTPEADKALRSGFVVKGRSATKDDETLFAIEGGYTRVYVDDDEDSKALRSGFVVKGRSATKEEPVNYVDINGDSINIQTTDFRVMEAPVAAADSSEPAQPKNLLTISAGNVLVDGDFMVAGDVEKKVEANAIDSVEMPAIAKIVDRADTISCSLYKPFVYGDQSDAEGYALLGIYSKGSYAKVTTVDASGNMVLLIDAKGNVTKRQKNATVAVLMAPGDSVLYIRPLKTTHQTISFGLMKKNATQPYQYIKLEAEVEAQAGVPFAVNITWEGDGSVTRTGSAIYGEKMVLEVVPEQGNVFAGWSDGNLRVKRTITVTNNVELNATFEHLNCEVNVTINNNKYGQVEGAGTYFYGDTATLVAVPNEGHSFIGWKGVPDSIAEKDTISIVVKSDLNITASFMINQYTLTFLTGCEPEWEPITADYGTEVGDIEAPAREGYEFADWNKDIPEFIVKNDTIVAQWDTNAYDITFVLGQAEWVVEDVKYGTLLKQITDTVKVAAKEGYSFSGWQTSYTTMPDNAITVTGEYEINKYDITFKVGETTVETISKVAYGSLLKQITDTVTAADKKGYTFDGWQTESTTMPDSAITIKGNYTPIDYTITFVTGNGEKIEPITAGYETDITEKLPTNKLTMVGYEFAGWSPELPSTMPFEGGTYVAQWTPNRHNVTFTANGELFAEFKDVEYNSQIPQPESNPEKEGYDFVGWNTDASATAGVTIGLMPDNDVVYYAIWSVNSYALVWNYNSGTLDETKPFTAAGQVLFGAALTAPTLSRAGYTPNGWSPSVATTMPAQDQTYTAQWTPNTNTPYTVIINKQNIDDDGYTPETITAYGTTDTETNYEAQPITGFTAKAFNQVNISGDGFATLTVNYDRVVKNAIWSADGAEFAKASYRYEQTIVKPADDPTKTGHSFTGWTGFTEGTKMGTEDVTFTAEFSKNSYAVTVPTGLELTGDVPTPVNDKYLYEYQANVTFKISDGYRLTDGGTVGYTCNGTTTALTADGNGNYTFAMPDAGENGVEITATGLTQYYTVTFVTGDGASTIDPVTVNSGQTVAQPENPTRDGYTFRRWMIGTEEYNFSSAVTSSFELTAEWAMTTFYVDGTTGGNGTAASPLASIADAVAAINTVNYKTDYTIVVKGKLSGSQSIADEPVYENPDDPDDKGDIVGYNPINADTLILTGESVTSGGTTTEPAIDAGWEYVNTGTDDWGNPIYNWRNVYEETASQAPALTISTATPVKITNLTITRGYDIKGGGIYIMDADTVILGDGVKITNNSADDYNEDNLPYGGGVYAKANNSKTALTILAGAEISNNYATCGGGICVEATEGKVALVTMQGGTIKNNTSDYHSNLHIGGGGVLAIGQNAKFIMNGGAVDGNTAAGYGGGVCVCDGAEFIMNGGSSVVNNTSGEEDDYNSTTGCGGGVLVNGATNDATFTMNGGSITGNHSYAYNNNIGGGGVCVYEEGNFEMQKGTIENNDAILGGGVYVCATSTQFDMKGGNIAGNHAEYGGNGVYMKYYNSQTGYFQMSGTAIVDANNDIYLDNNNGYVFIHVGEFTFENETEITKVATITPASYAQPVLMFANQDLATQDNCNRFAITPNGGATYGLNPQPWGDTPVGTLYQTAFGVTFYMELSEEPVETLTVKYNNTVPLSDELNNPTKDHYQFLGWYKVTYTSNGPVIADEPFDFSELITSNTTLVAQWEQTEAVVTFYRECRATGSLGNMSVVGESCGTPLIVSIGEKIPVNAIPTPDSVGYDFVDWYLVKGADKNGVEYEESPFNFTERQITGDIELCATWKPKPIYVSEKTPDDANAALGTEAHPYRTIAEACAAMTSNEKYTIVIDGMLTSPQSITSKTNVTIKGKNELVDGVPQDGIDLTGNTSGKSALYITSEYITLQNLKLTGATLSGEGDDSKGALSINAGYVTLSDGLLITGNRYADNAAEKTGGGVYISTTANTYIEGSVKVAEDNDVYMKAYYNSNTGAISNWAKLYVKGALTNDPAATITPAEYITNRPKYVNILSTADQSLKNEFSKIAVTPQVVNDLVCCWKVNTSSYLERITTATFNYNDGSGRIVGVPVDAEGKITPPTNPTRDGYAFAGWYESVDNTTTNLSSDAFDFDDAISSDVLIVAKWTQTTFYVKPQDAGGNNSNDGLTSGTALASIITALNKIKNGSDDSEIEYTIKIVGQLTEDVELDSDWDDIAGKITFEGATEYEGYEPEDVITGSGANPVFKIETSAPIVIANLKITGGSSMLGGGIYLNAEDADVTLDNGALITNNTATGGFGGGGVNIQDGKLTMLDGSTITGNQTTGGTSGGGVQLDGGTLDMQGGEIYGNTADGSFGSDVYFSSGTLLLSGAPVIGELYLDNENIELTENLTRGASINIVPSDYDEPTLDVEGLSYTTLLTAASGVSVADNIEYFDIIQPSDGKNWIIAISEENEGFLSYECTVTTDGEVHTVKCGTKMDDPGEPSDKPYGVDEESEFVGWFKDGVRFDFENDYVMEDIELTSLWVKPQSTLYVTPGYEGGNSDGTATAPFVSIQDALDAIYLFNKSDWDYTINVNGYVQNQVVIGDLPANSIKLLGVGDGGGISIPAYGSMPLSIETEVPVVLQNFKVSIAGYVGHSVSGATAVAIGSGADVTFAEGTEIDGNNAGANSEKAGVVVKGKLTMSGNAKIHGFIMTTSSNNGYICGGGVWVENGELVMEGTSSIYDCRTNDNNNNPNDNDYNHAGGGGIRIQSGTVTMRGDSKIYNCSAKYLGGAVGIQGGSFTMNGDASISGCSTDNDKKCAVHVHSGTFTMNGGSISSNTGHGVWVDAYIREWGGIYYPNNGTFVMTNGTISGNSGDGVEVSGSTKDVYEAKAVFDMRGGTISGNTGHGVNVLAEKNVDTDKVDAGTFKMSGSASIDDVYLGYNQVGGNQLQTRITITGQLAAGTRAVITPGNYSEGAQVLELGAGVTSTSLDAECGKFAVTPNGGAVDWIVNTNGYLQIYKPEGGLGGKFSVGDDKQVYFSQGNLQYQASTQAWQFAENQWEHIGNNPGNTVTGEARATQSDWIDLFGWGTSGHNNDPYMTDQTGNYGDGANDIAGTQYDWGVKNAISNGGNVANKWRTLTSGEWTYLLKTRTTSSGLRYAMAQVQGVNGLVLLPDNWSTSTYTFSSTNPSISNENWSKIEAAGAVFLPVTGYRMVYEMYYADLYGNYWSSSTTSGSTTNAGGICFDANDLTNDDSFSRYFGRAVRLVQDVVEENGGDDGITLYVSPDGDDNYDGTTRLQAVKTFEQALSLMTEAKPYTIELVEGDFTQEVQTLTDDSDVNATKITIDGKGKKISLSSSEPLLKITTEIPVEIKNLEISGNTSGGGGLYVEGSNCTVTLGEGTKIINNNAGSGGGVRNEGQLIIDGAEISGNTATDDGGGIYVEYDGKIDMRSGSISNNTAGRSGGGIYFYGSTVTLTGGTISGNIANGDGGGAIYAGCQSTFSMGGSVYIPAGATVAGAPVTGYGKNDVLLDYYEDYGHMDIRIVSNLTAEASVVATITPTDYSGGYAVVRGYNIQTSSNDNGLLEANYNKFAVTPQTKDEEGETLDTPVVWYVDSEGKLTTTNPNP